MIIFYCEDIETNPVLSEEDSAHAVRVLRHVEGDEVTVNQPLMIVEAMKMETTFVSPVNAVVDKVYAAPGERVNTEDLLISFILKD